MTAGHSHDDHETGPDDSHGGHGGHAGHDPTAGANEKSLKIAFALAFAFLRACPKLSCRESLEGRGGAKGAGLRPPQTETPPEIRHGCWGLATRSGWFRFATNR